MEIVTRRDIVEKLRRFLTDHGVEVEMDEINDADKITMMGGDELDVTNFVITLEDEYGVHLETSDWCDGTVSELCRALNEALHHKNDLD